MYPSLKILEFSENYKSEEYNGAGMHQEKGQEPLHQKHRIDSLLLLDERA